MKSTQATSSKTSRIENILSFRAHHSLRQTGEKFGISGERVRQIQMLKHRKRCKVHDRYYYNTCSHCFIGSYVKLINFSDLNFILNECKKESKNKSRDWLSVQRRVVLIKVLRIKFNYSLSKIAGLLSRDSTTINHLYHNYIHE